MPFDVLGANFAWREGGGNPVAPTDGARHPEPDPGKPVVVFLHGLGGSRISWEPQLEALSPEFRTIAWDLPGYGESPPLEGPMTFAALADAVVGFFDEIQADEVHLVGISFGGMIAQYTAAKYPARIRSLTLLSTSPKFGLDGTRPEDWLNARLAPLNDGLEPVDFADRVLSAIAGPHISDAAVSGQRAAMARITGDALRRSIACLVTHDSFDVLPLIEAPTMCLVGELDVETPPAYGRAIAEGIRHARLETIAGAGHLLNVEAPDTVNALIVAHVGSNTAKGRTT